MRGGLRPEGEAGRPGEPRAWLEKGYDGWVRETRMEALRWQSGGVDSGEPRAGQCVVVAADGIEPSTYGL